MIKINSYKILPCLSSKLIRNKTVGNLINITKLQ